MKHNRTFSIETRADDAATAGDVVISVAISSEAPYLRQGFNGHAFAYEVLGHTAGEIDLSYMNGAPFFIEHDTYNLNAGALENVRLDTDGVLRGDVRFSNRPEALALQDDMRRGIRSRISVGYEIQACNDVGVANDGTPMVRVSKWKPYEVSSVAIPADITVGVGRSMETFSGLDTMKRDDAAAVPGDNATTAPAVDISAMTPDELLALQAQIVAALQDDEASEAVAEPVAKADDAAPVDPNAAPTDPNATKSLLIVKTVETKTNTNGAAKMLTKEENAKLIALAVKYGKTADLATWQEQNRSVESVSAEILGAMDNTATVINAPAVIIKKGRETMADAIRSGLRGENSELLERGMDQARKAGKRIVSGRIYLPTDVEMLDAVKVRQKFAQRAGLAFSTSTNGTGKEFLSFEESLREGALLAKLGGDIRTFSDAASLPYWGTGITATTAHETGSLSVQSVAVSLRTLNPKRIGATTTVSNLMGRLNGTYDLMSEVYTEVLADTERMIQSQSFGGAGSGFDLQGLSTDSNIAVYAPTPVSGTLGISAASAMISVVAKNNADYENGAWVVAHDVYAYMESTAVFGNGSGKSVLESVSSRNPVFRTGYLSAPNAGQFSAMFGDWSKVTLGLFGGIELRTDDISSAGSAQTIITSEIFADIVARQPAALVRWNKVLSS